MSAIAVDLAKSGRVSVLCSRDRPTVAMMESREKLAMVEIMRVKCCNLVFLA